MLDLNKPLQTRSGQKVTFLKKFTSPTGVKNLVCLIDVGEGREKVAQHTEEGHFYADTNWDLINVPEKRTLYCVVFYDPNRKYRVFMRGYETLEARVRDTKDHPHYKILEEFTREVTLP